MSGPPIFVTTSWDDGHELDTKLALFLADHGYEGTFYVSPRSHELPPGKRISDSSLRDLSSRFEVGSHTLTHPHLTRISEAEAVHEITDGKRAVEDVLGGEVTSFCYPYGAYSSTHVEMVRAAGFRVARTIRRFDIALPADPLQMATTTHAARYKADGVQALRRSRSLPETIRMWRQWDRLARRVYEDVYEHGGLIHIFGHSWEIEANGDWDRLSSLLRELADHDNVTMLTNAKIGDLRDAR